MFRFDVIINNSYSIITNREHNSISSSNNSSINGNIICILKVQFTS